MIYNVSGRLTFTSTNFAVIESGGIGFKCITTMNTLKQIGGIGDTVNLFTYLNVREDAMDLFGFYDRQELECFKLLISVSGIGPKAAIAILSELSPEKLTICISSGDYKALTKAQGVGKKIAERAVLELKDKITSIVSSETVIETINSVAQISSNDDASEAVAALVALGFTQSDAATVISKFDKNLSVDEMIRQGLKYLSRQV